MAEAVGALRVDLSANSAQFDSDIRRARGSLAGFGGEFSSFGAVAGGAGEELAGGLRTSTRELSHLGSAFGLAGGEGTRFAYALSAITLEGINPLAIAVVGVGLGIGALIEHFKEAGAEAKKTAADGLKEYENALKKIETESDGVVKHTETLLDRLHSLQSESGDKADQLGMQRQIDAQQKRYDFAAGQSLNGSNAAGWAAEMQRTLENIDQLKRAGYETDSREVQNQQRLHDIAQSSWKQLEDVVNAEGAKLASLKDQLATMQRLAAEEEASKARAAQLAENIKSSKTADAARAKQAKADAKEASKALADLVEGLREIEAADSAWAFGADSIAIYRKDVAEAVKDQKDETKAIAETQREMRSLGEWIKRIDDATQRDADKLAAMYADVAEKQRQAFEKTDAVAGWDAEMQKLTADSQKYGEVAAKLADTVTTTFSQDLTSALIEIQTQSKSAKQAFTDFATAVVLDFEKMIVEALIFRAVTSMIGFGGAASTATQAGTDAINSRTSDLAAMESVGYAKSMVIELHTHGTPQQVDSVQQSVGPDGSRRLKVMVSDAIAEDVMSGGKASRAMAAAFSLGRAPRRRA